ncbi:DUF551 domain-containing protein [Cronobacter sakazakii]|nr:DUF551 domain-containing protein [Cronobacter sakazakii]ELY4597347.1 DUF551 domain-containing protein [Cronobacter sakazakii]
MSTISNERVEFYATTKPPFGYTGSDINTMARELLALRKEREKAEPSYYLNQAVPAAYEINADATDYHRGWNACRAAMLQSGNDEIGSWRNPKNTPTDKAKSEMSQMAEKLVRDTTALAATLSAETDTTAQQFESLAGKAVSGWIPCSERMPVEKDIVLVVDDGYFVCEAQYREGDFFSAVRGNNEFFETTCRDVEFWQPLPEPPCK